MRYVGFVTKGLELIAEKEILRLILDAEIVEVGSKRIVFETGESFENLLQLKTPDDVCIYIANEKNINTGEEILSTIREVDFQKYFSLIKEFRDLDATFSLTLSLVGLDREKTEDLVGKLSSYIENKYGWKFSERDHTNFDIRVFVDHNNLFIGARLSKESLYNRNYKKSSKLGSLKPTIAAAMVQLATEGKKGNMVDTFCGSGTILCEALLSGNHISGSDIDPESVEITKSNIKEINYKDNSIILCQSALRTHFNDQSFDFAVSNLPWDKQIKVESITDLYIGALHEYKRILKKHGILCVLVTKPELFIKHAKYILNPINIDRIPVSLLGQSPTILLFKL